MEAITQAHMIPVSGLIEVSIQSAVTSGGVVGEQFPITRMGHALNPVIDRAFSQVVLDGWRGF